MTNDNTSTFYMYDMIMKYVICTVHTRSCIDVANILQY